MQAIVSISPENLAFQTATRFGKVTRGRGPLPHHAAAAAAMLLAAACGGSSAGENSPAGSPAAAQASCTLPLVHDIYDGYHIGVPAGWNLFTIGGTVVVARDSSGTEETVVHPALMTSGETASGLFTTLLRCRASTTP